MFGAKKRQYQNAVAQQIVGMAAPYDIHDQTQKLLYLMKTDIVDHSYSRDILPIHAATLMIYQSVKVLHTNRKEPGHTSALDAYKETFASAAANILGEDLRQLLNDEMRREMETMVEEISSSRVYANDVITYGELMESAIARRAAISSMMK
jgi:hypothetical protein